MKYLVSYIDLVLERKKINEEWERRECNNNNKKKHVSILIFYTTFIFS
jgi:hypothetical protein